MFLVTDTETLERALTFINSQELLAYDTETTGLNVRKDLVIGFGVSSYDAGFYVPIYRFDAASNSLHYCGDSARTQQILKALAQKKLLMFNASFDARVTWHSLGVDLLPALHTDVLLLKHTCDEEFPFGLKEIAARLFGHEVKSEKEEVQASIKANGGTSVQYFKAATETLAKYCVQDCRLTYRLYHYYAPELQRQGLHDFFYQDEVMPLYKTVTISMEEAGVRVDVPGLQKAKAELEADLKKLNNTIQSAIAPYLDIFTDWFLNKDYPFKATGHVGKHMKKNGGSLREAQLHVWQAHSNGEPMFNLLSKYHLKKLFFDTLDEEPLSRTPTGQPQVDEDFLAAMAPKYEWCALLIDYNKLTKLNGTYISRLLEEAEDGRFYPSFQQHRTVSGRYAGDMQQLPRPLEEGQASELVRKYNNLIRSFILPSEGHVLCSSDYEQLEPSIFAHVSGDANLQRIFNDGLDFYSEVAIRTENLRDVSSDKSAPNYLGRVNKSARQRAKAYALGIAYGMTGYKLQFEINTDQDTADKLVEDYLNAFPQLKEWMHASKEQAIYQGMVRTQSGRVRHLPRAVSIFRRYGPQIHDSLQLWKTYHAQAEEYAKVKADYKELKNLLNNAINFQIQGLAASIVNRAAIQLVRDFKARNMATKIVAQIHDELVFDIPINEVAECTALIQEVMQNITKLAVPLKTAPQTGNNFKECK